MESRFNVETRKPLTLRQADILAKINSYWREHLRSPSLRDVCEAIGIDNPNGVRCHLTALEKKGWLYRDGRATRGLITYEVERALSQL